ncbi:MAG: hypothetical protein CVT60_03370 [Actinobacteria bacterium HGW-Actinobacteria-10]|jgi:hypothetical protein|nr:MAG: hypothetical protein CVT60_03370 [Actinobacteria bacterium HGW-Actinobacteria-10]
MKSVLMLAATTITTLFGAPALAYATPQEVIVPGWLSYGSGLVGLVIAVGLLVNAALLKRVSAGSMIADNIVYLMLGIVCVATSVLVGWSGSLPGLAGVTGFLSFIADLLITAGMALFTVYFFRVRTAMTRYLRSMEMYRQSASEEPTGKDRDE